MSQSESGRMSMKNEVLHTANIYKMIRLENNTFTEPHLTWSELEKEIEAIEIPESELMESDCEKNWELQCIEVKRKNEKCLESLEASQNITDSLRKSLKMIKRAWKKVSSSKKKL